MERQEAAQRPSGLQTVTSKNLFTFINILHSRYTLACLLTKTCKALQNCKIIVLNVFDKFSDLLIVN